MKRNILKYITLLFALLAVLFIFACTAQNEYAPPLPGSSATPPPVISEVRDAFTANLFFISDVNTLDVELRTLTRTPGATRADAAMRALVVGPESPTLSPAINTQKQKYAHVELAGDICMVYLTGAHHDVRDILPARAAVASTVYEAEGIPYADVYVDGMQPGFYGRPLGALAPLSLSTNVNTQELSPSTNDETAAVYHESRNAPLFFTDRSGQFISCKIRPITYDTQTSIQDIISILMDELLIKPANSMLLSPLPKDLQLLECKIFSINAELNYEEMPPGNTVIDYESIVELTFSQPDEAFDMELANAAITYTITSFLPKISGVKVTYSNIGDPLQQAIIPPMTRQQFSALLGHTITIFYPDPDGAWLLPFERIIPQANIYDPLCRLDLLCDVSANDAAPLLAFEKEDFLSVTIYGDLAVVNTRQGFYDKLDAFTNHLSPTDNAKMHIFSIVNTLANYPDIDRVWVLEEGERIDASLDMLYLGNALYANIGLNLTD